MRRAIRETRKLRISYCDAQGKRSGRTVWPIAMAYYADVTVLGAWCERRHDFRHFRVERILASRVLDDRFPAEGGKLVDRWFALQERDGTALTPRSFTQQERSTTRG